MGTDEVAPQDQASYLKIMDMYKPLLDKLTPEAREKIMKGNYERLFDAARIKVRAWEKAHLGDPVKTPRAYAGFPGRINFPTSDSAAKKILFHNPL